MVSVEPIPEVFDALTRNTHRYRRRVLDEGDYRRPDRFILQIHYDALSIAQIRLTINDPDHQ